MALGDFIDRCPIDQCVVARVGTAAEPDGHELVLGDEDFPSSLDDALDHLQGLVDDIAIWRWNGAGVATAVKGGKATRISAWYCPLQDALELLGS
jgi:hypothetical protein